jgi:hypothetical protein
MQKNFSIVMQQQKTATALKTTSIVLYFIALMPTCTHFADLTNTLQNNREILFFAQGRGPSALPCNRAENTPPLGGCISLTPLARQSSAFRAQQQFFMALCIGFISVFNHQ